MLFYFIFTPFGLIAKIFSKDLRNIKGSFKKNEKTNFKDFKDKINFHNQF